MPPQFQLETRRLLLRPWRHGDLAPYAEINADPRVRRFFPALLTREESDGQVAGFQSALEQLGYSILAAEDRVTHELLGFVGILPLGADVVAALQARLAATQIQIPSDAVEVGWRLRHSSWGQGLATEGARAVLRHAFVNLRMPTVYSLTSALNLPSRRAMERLGMTHLSDANFNHPHISSTNPLCSHVLYRIHAQDFH